MPEPSASPNTPGSEEEPVTYFEFRPFKESPPQPRSQPVSKTQRAQPQAPIVSSGQQAKSEARQNTPSKPHQVPEKQLDSTGAAKNRQQPASEGSGQRQPSVGPGKQQQNGVVTSETTRAKPHAPTSSSSTAASSLDGSTSVQQQAKKSSEKPVSKISVSSEMEEHWMPDKMCHECSECGVRFGIFVRKHHCRICGRIFCSSCSSHSVPAYHLRSDMNGTLRVCLECFKIYQESLVKKKGGKQDSSLPAKQHQAAYTSSLPSSFPEGSGGSTTHDRAEAMPITSSRHSWEERPLPEAAGSPSRGSTIEFDNPVFFRRSFIRQAPLPGVTEESILAITEDEVGVCLEEIWKKLEDPVRGISPQTHRYRWHTFPQSFAAREIVEWLLRHGHAYSREMAVRIGQALVHTKFLFVVSSVDQEFRDVDGIFLEAGEAAKLPKQTQSTMPTVADAPNWFLSDEGEDAAKQASRPPSVPTKPKEVTTHETEVNIESGSARFRKLRKTFGGQRRLKKKPVAETKKEFVASLPAHMQPKPPPPPVAEEPEYKESPVKKRSREEASGAVSNGRLEVQPLDLPQVTISSPPPNESPTILQPPELLDSPMSPHMSFSIVDQNTVIRALPFGLSKATESSSRGRDREELMKRILSDHDKHLSNMIVQLLKTFGLSLSWLKILRPLILEGCKKVQMDVYNDDFMDIRHYIKVKKIPGGQKSACSYVSGVIFSKHVTHKKMHLSIRNPRILLLKCAMEFQRHDNQLSSFDTLLTQEEQYLKNLVERIKKCRPNIILVQKSVSRSALEMLHHHGIVVVLNVKPSVMGRVARGTQGQLLYSLDQLSFAVKLGTCGHFYVKTFTLPDNTHKTLMYFDDCDPKLGGVITLQGGPNHELKRVKQVAEFGLHIGQNMTLESSFLADEFADPGTPVVDTTESSEYSTPPSTPDLVMFPFSPFDQQTEEKIEKEDQEEDRKVALPTLQEEEEEDRKEDKKEEGDKENESKKNDEVKTEAMKDKIDDKVAVDGESPDQSEVKPRSLSTDQDRETEDPIQDSLKPPSEEDPLPKPPAISAEKAFEDILKSQLISSSPHMTFSVPYLEAKKGSTASIRRYLPQEIYWSHIFNPKGLSTNDRPSLGRSNSHRTKSQSSYRQYGIEPATKHSYRSVSNHPLTSSILLFPAHSPEIKAVMADFRARASLPDEPSCYFFPTARKAADIYSQLRLIFNKSIEFEQKAKQRETDVALQRARGRERLSQRQQRPRVQSSVKRPVPTRRAKRWTIPEKSRYLHSSSSSSRSVSPVRDTAGGGDLLDYVMQTTHPADSNNESIVELDIPRGMVSVFDQHNASPEPGQGPATRDESASPSGEWSILMEEQLLPDTDERDCLDPFNHQFIALQFSSTCHDGQKRPYPCVLPCMIPMNYYGKNDIPLGEFLRRYCFRDMYICQACGVDMAHHHRHFVHRNMELRVTMQQLESAIPGCDSNGLFTWLTCKQCSESTPLMPMSEDSLCLSFAKFLELKFYGSSYGPHLHGSNTCTHPLHSNYIQHFCYQMKVATFEPLQSTLLEVGIPPQKITMATSTDRAQFHHDYLHEITHLGKLIEAVFYRVNQYLQLYGAVDGVAGLVQDTAERTKTMRASLRHKVRMMKDLSVTSGLVKPTWVLKEEGEEVQLFYLLQDSTAELKRSIADMVLCCNLELDTVDSKVREVRDTANKRENPWESFNSTAIVSETSPSVSAVSSSSPHSSPNLRHRPLLSDGGASPRDLSPNRKMDDSGKERSGSGNSSDGSTRLQVDGSDERQQHRRNLSDSMTLARSGGSAEESSEGMDSSDGGRASKLHVVRHARHHSLTEPMRRAEREEPSSREEDSELVRTVKEGDQKWAQQQRAITEEVTDFVNKLRGKDIEDPTKFYCIRSSLQMTADLSFNEDTPKPGPRSSPVICEETSSEGAATRRTPLSASSKKTLQDKISLLLSKPFQKLPQPFESSEHHLLRGNLKFTIAVYENEPTSIIAFALCSREYSHELSVAQQEEKRKNDCSDFTTSTTQPSAINAGDLGPSPTAASKATTFVKNLWRKSQAPSPSASESAQGGGIEPSPESFWSENGGEGGLGIKWSPADISSSSNGRFSSSQENGHISMEFADETTKFFCKIYYAEEFRKMRSLIFPSGEDRFIRSLARCVRFDAKGGKSRAMFSKTFEDRLIMKQVQMVEITSFVEIAPKYFKHVTDALDNARPLVLAKILGAYSIGFRNSKTGRSQRHHVIIMENLLYGHKCSKVFDLKGSMRGRYVSHNPKKDSKGDVLMDENFLEFIYSNPVYVWPHSKAVLIRAISADTQFLADSHIMDYSLLTAIDEEKGEVVVGVIDFVRPFTFDKRLEMMIKKAGRSILPTIVYPSLYRRRFIEAMERYFTPVPDKWTGLGADIRI